jgi:glycerol-3-phosphate O-acyltransferase
VRTGLAGIFSQVLSGLPVVGSPVKLVTGLDPVVARVGSFVLDASNAPPDALVPARAEDEAALNALRSGRHPSSMVLRPGRLMSRIVAWILSGVVLARRGLDVLLDAQDSGSVIYVMRSPRLVDYIYFNDTYARNRLKLVLLAPGIRTWSLRPFFSGLAALFRGKRGLPDDATSMVVLARAGEPSMVYLQPGGGKDEEADRARVLPLLERLVREHRERGTNVLFVPQLLIWDKRPDTPQPGLLDGLLGRPRSSGFIRQIYDVIQTIWQSFLMFGAPTVQVSDPIRLGDLIERSGASDDAMVAARVYNELLDQVDREQRVIVGPGVKPARVIQSEILGNPRTHDQLMEVAASQKIDRTELQKRSRKILKEIAADFNLLAIKAFSALLAPIWSRIYEGIEVDTEGLERVRRAALDRRLVIVPSHKSHVDYLVMSYLFYQNGLMPPHIAAGVNLSFWPIGPLFRRAGAFFLRRSFAGDPVYPVLFNAYLAKLIEEGFAIEFFIEGTRSRTGKLNPPKYGMLNMIVDAFRDGNADNLAFVPVSVGYEYVIEGNSYRKELTGGEKKSEGIGDLLKAPKILTSRYGRVYVEFAEPVDLRDFLGEYGLDLRGEIAPDELAQTIRRLAYRIIHRINDVTTVSPTAVAALILLNAEGKEVAHADLVRSTGFALELLRGRKARLSRTLHDSLLARVETLTRQRGSGSIDELDDFDRQFISQPIVPVDDEPVSDEAVGRAVEEPMAAALRLLGEKKLIEVKHGAEAVRYAVPDERRLELSFYRNNIVHYLVADAVFATAVGTAANPETGRVEVARAREVARFLSGLFKYEFCFEERRRFDEVFLRTGAFFAERDWMDRPADDTVWAVRSPRPEGFEFMRRLLSPVLESYWISASVLGEEAEEWVDQKALVKRMVAAARQAAASQRITHHEAVAQVTLESALRIWREWGVLETRSDDKAKRGAQLLRVSVEYQGARLDALVDLLRAMAHGEQYHGQLP